MHYGLPAAVDAYIRQATDRQPPAHYVEQPLGASAARTEFEIYAPVLLMFFSGAISPIPHMALFTISGRGFAPTDLLPPAHAVVALNKVFTLGAGLGDVLYELAALTALSMLYFAVGVWLFQRTHMRAE